ncbi:60S acidic ribosomal protein P1-like [Mastomys coucha]|uniref:60S acidic ribosomal protein P1-like n=1 Tax=Mastomys coucha TaxID=35658 RepID=UPI001261ACD5|nr:60S acidic ribosomal protein P1-like [Mastomys coucha]
MASVSEFACICSALILHHIGEVTVTAGPNVNSRSLIYIGAGGLTPAAGSAFAGGPAPSTTTSLAEEKKVEAKKEESEDSDDNMGFGLFD